MVVVAEGCRRTAFLLLEDAVEVADIIEAAAEAYLSHTGMCIDKQSGCIAQAGIDDVVADGLSCAGTEETAEGCRGHSGNVGECLQTNLALEVLVDVLFHSTHSAALGCVLHIGKRLTCQQMVVVLQREFIENLEQSNHPVETVLDRSHARYLSIDFHNGRKLEGNASLGILEEFAKCGELVLLHELFAKQVARELNRYLVNGVALAVVLVPHMLQATAQEHEVVLAKHLDTVAHNTTSSVAMFNEIQLHFLVPMQRIGKRIFVSVHHQETVSFP